MDINSEESKMIISKGLRTPHSCTCNTCADMCRKEVCIGTPSDILAIAEAGYIESLQKVGFAAGLSYGIPIISMLQLKRKPGTNECVMFNDGLCTLHDLGLKPTEGVLAFHTPTVIEDVNKVTVFNVAKTWLDDSNTPKAIKIIDLINKNNEKHRTNGS